MLFDCASPHPLVRYWIDCSRNNSRGGLLHSVVRQMIKMPPWNESAVMKLVISYVDIYVDYPLNPIN